MLGCGGGGEGLVILLLEASRARLGAALLGGGGISVVAALLELEVASNGCLDVGLFEPAREAFGAGVAEAFLFSPIVIKMNSLRIPSSLYFNCIGQFG